MDQTLNYTHWLVSDLLCDDFTQLLLPDLTEFIPLPGVHVTLEGDEVIKKIQIMENEFECLTDRGGRGEKILVLAEVIMFSTTRFSCRY